MPKMGKYCKAYPVPRFRQYPFWAESTENLRKRFQTLDGVQTESQRPLTEDDFLYLQENFVVTDGIFLDQNVVFQEVTEDWIEFCRDNLKFEVPAYAAAETK